MNIKTLATTTTKVTVAAAVLSMALITGTANAGGYAYSNHRSPRAVFDYAKVLSSEPIVRYVTVTTPVKECWEETVNYAQYNRRAGSGVGTIFGAIIGGVIGHQIGSGHGRDAATVAGTLLGATIGSSTSRRIPDYDSTEYSRPVTRCKTNYQTHEEERIDGYRVVYSYHGQKYATRTPNDPGQRLRIRVDVRPAP